MRRAAALAALALGLAGCRDKPAPATSDPAPSAATPARSASSAPATSSALAAPASPEDRSAAEERLAIDALRAFGAAAGRGDEAAAKAAAWPECWARECGALTRAKVAITAGDKASVAGTRAVVVVLLTCDGSPCARSAHLARPCEGDGPYRVTAIESDMNADASFLMMGMMGGCGPAPFDARDGGRSAPHDAGGDARK